MKPLFNSGVYNKEENNSYLKPVIVQFYIFSHTQEVCVCLFAGVISLAPLNLVPPQTPNKLFRPSPKH